MTSRLAVTAAWVGALLFTLGGVWALFAPHLFFAVIATYPPYNRHLFHDVGAFQLGIAAALAAGIAVAGRSPSDCGRRGGRDGVRRVALDRRGSGGRSTDPVLVTLVALVLVVGLVAAEVRR
jgi:hypothetical protein